MSISATNPPDHVSRSYVAFISYRHADNVEEGRQWANWLHHGLETYEVPEDLVGTRNTRGETIPARLFPVFRDEVELPADADLSSAILRALTASRFLIVLCSPGAVASRFVADEIIEFKRLGKADHIIAAILSGEPNAKVPAGGTEKPDGRECFPDPLKFELSADGGMGTTPAQPLAADFRLPDGGQGWTNSEAYRQALEVVQLPANEISSKVRAYERHLETMKLKVIAGILGVPLGVLTERDKAYRLSKEQQRTRNLRRWLAVVGVLALIAVIGGGLALIKQREAQQRQAEVVAALATSDFQQGTQALGNPDATPNGMALLARAVRDGGHEGALTRLWTLLQQRAFWLPAVNGEVDAIPDKTAAQIPAGVSERFAHVEIQALRLIPSALEISADGKRVATAAGNAALDGVTGVRVWTIDGEPLTPWLEPDYAGDFYVQALDVRLSPDGRFVAMIASPNREPQYVEIREVDKLKRWGAHIEATGKGPHYQHAPLTVVKFLPDLSPESMDSILLLTASGKGDASVHYILEDRTTHIAQNRHRTRVVVAESDAGQEWLMSASDDGEVLVSSLATGGNVGNPIQMEEPATAISRNGPTRLAIRRQRGETRFYDLKSRMSVAIPTAPGKLRQRSLCVDWRAPQDPAADRTRLVHPVSGHRILYEGKRAFSVTPPPGETGESRELRFSNDLALVCLDRERPFVFSTTETFVTEAWTLSGTDRLGRPLIERRLFSPGETPDEARAISLSPDGKSVLVHSFLWNPPNSAHHWFSLWDLNTGLLLMDRVHIRDDGFQERSVEHAEFDDSGEFILFLEQQRKDVFTVDSSLQIRPPLDVTNWLPELAEAIGGVTFDDSGNLTAAPDRLVNLNRLLPKLRHYGSGDHTPAD